MILEGFLYEYYFCKLGTPWTLPRGLFESMPLGVVSPETDSF
jgi:hypothetical protein